MERPIHFEKVDHFFGNAETRRQVLFEVDLEIDRGEIVILTGPSGSGKTTALTLAGALRSAQHGSLCVLGEELRNAPRSKLISVRRNIGYIFQAHNLLAALTARRNVQIALALDGDLSRSEQRKRSTAMLEAVGLEDRANAYPNQLSGGQRQRVAIARALVSQPQIVLADEPTASLDKQSGRSVVTLLEKLARDRGTTVILVTHDNRILDIADRIVHLEDGRISSFGEAVAQNTQHMMHLLTESNRKGDLARRVSDLDLDQFKTLLSGLTFEAEEFMRTTELASSETFTSMLDQLLDICTRKVGDLLQADRASLFLLDVARNELWSKVARDGGGAPFEIRIPRDSGIAGAVAATGEIVNLADAYSDSRFHPEIDRESNYRTKTLLCVPIRNRQGEIFGVAQLLNKRGGELFDADDIERFRNFMDAVRVLLESWWHMTNEAESGNVAT